jgi:putative phosphotransacetylase|nr:phosphate propanoyltransferase [Parageobacillus toebii]
MSNGLQDKIFKAVMKRIQEIEEGPYVPIGISNRHVHLSQEDLESLFGKNYRLTKLRDLKQPGQFAANETVTLKGPKGEIQHVRILGPVRSKTQVEISITDSFQLGISVPVRESGNIAGTPGIIIQGPKGVVKLKEGVIAALRHIHVPPEFAEKFQLKDKDMVDVEVGKERKTIFKNVLIRVSKNYVLEMHLDTDEANAAGLKNGDIGKIVK